MGQRHHFPSAAKRRIMPKSTMCIEEKLERAATHVDSHGDDRHVDENEF